MTNSFSETFTVRVQDADRWKLISLCMGYIIFLLFAYSESLSLIHSRWTSRGELDYGYVLLALIFLCLFRATPPVPKPTGSITLMIVALALIQIFVLVSHAADLISLTQLGFLGSWVIAALLLCNYKFQEWAVRSALIMLSALPINYLLIEPLQTLTVAMVSLVLPITGLSFHLSGTFFEVSAGVVQVADGCSGHKYFIAAFALVMIHNTFVRQSLVRELLFVALVLMSALVANWVRVSLLINLAPLVGIDAPIMQDHDWLGWFIFALSMISAFSLERFLPDFNRHELTLGHAISCFNSDTHRTFPIFFAVFLLILLPAYPQFVSIEYVHQKPIQLSSYLSGQIQTQDASLWRPAYRHYSKLLESSHEIDGVPVRGFQYFVFSDQEGVELINSENVIFDEEAGWAITKDEIVKIPHGSIRKELATNRVGESRLAIYWFSYGGTLSASKLNIKLSQLLDVLTAKRRVSSISILTSNCRLEDCDNLAQKIVDRLTQAESG